MVWFSVNQKDPNYFACGEDVDYNQNPEKCTSWVKLLAIESPPRIGLGRELDRDDVALLFEDGEQLVISSDGRLISGVKRTDDEGRANWDYVREGCVAFRHTLES